MPDSLKLPPPRCRADIDREALQHNFQVCSELAGESRRVMAIVKADAYGHGIEETGRILAEAGATWFGVANVEEAIRLKDAIPAFDGILVLSAVACGDEREKIITHGFSGSISSKEELSAFSETATSLQKNARIHIAIDTGMGRMGIDEDSALGLIESASNAPGNLILEGIATHFPSADEDAEFTRSQIQRFRALIAKAGPLPESCLIHLANSAGLIGFQSEMPEATLVRPGLALYGISPLSDIITDLRPTLSLKTRITLIRDLKAGSGISYGRTFITEKPITRVATLAAGYGDGYPRHLSGNGAEVLIAGKRCPLLGRVTMDQIVVDISHLPNPDEANVGDDAILIGSANHGDEAITFHEIAQKAGTIPWEILTGLTNRVRRVYH